ncbi:YopX family protein [Paenibacillus sp. JSM ZJ436]|uniref:YopX family protein n=1 Tax=Paenibacillus sp. JSM ZJ436 TaxID=3376190 RepID=UPI00379A3E4E
MKREIRFRGKRKDNGEWVSGSLLNNLWGKTVEIVDPSEYPDYDSLEDIVYLAVEVDLETVGQYTGLHDRNGKEIYEGDIAIHESCNTCIVVYDSNRAKFKMCTINMYKSNVGNSGWTGFAIELRSAQFEIIGNRWDNPDLLEG